MKSNLQSYILSYPLHSCKGLRLRVYRKEETSMKGGSMRYEPQIILIKKGGRAC